RHPVSSTLRTGWRCMYCAASVTGSANAVLTTCSKAIILPTLTSVSHTVRHAPQPLSSPPERLHFHRYVIQPNPPPCSIAALNKRSLLNEEHMIMAVIAPYTPRYARRPAARPSRPPGKVH